MTRINSNIDPKYLTDQHLMAEYRELPMVYAALNRSRRTISDIRIIQSIPPTFTLNKGHVKFFYNKLLYLDNRYKQLISELKTRGYDLDPKRTYNIYKFPECYIQNWESTVNDDKIIKKRIYEKIQMKPQWYKYYRKPLMVNWIEYLNLNDGSY